MGSFRGICRNTNHKGGEAPLKSRGKYYSRILLQIAYCINYGERPTEVIGTRVRYRMKPLRTR